MPPHQDPKVPSYRDRYPTPDDLPPTQFWVDSPLETKAAIPQSQDILNPVSRPPNTASRTETTKQCLPTRQQPKQASNSKKTELRFFNVTDPKELKDRSQLRLNRQHVMHTYLDKERQKPSGQRDVRVDGAGAAQKRKRSRIQVPTPFTASLTLSADNQRRNLPTPSECSYASDKETEHRETPLQQNDEHHKKARPGKQDRDKDSQQLIKGLNGNFDNSRYIRAKWEDIPFVESIDPDTMLGAPLNPFNTWPTFSDESINVNRLKWSCSRRFGSEGIALYWVPQLLRARHAFLSTICISSAHDDIMARASSANPPPWLSTREGVERMRVRSEVIGLVNQSLGDPELRTADATIISVLHLLNSEVMGCDDRVMKTHQDGLHRMVRQRGGLEGLGVNGQLARILSITMYIISVLRESPPHPDFIAYASRQAAPISTDARVPESPIYHRPSGFQTITNKNCPSSETWDLLNDLRDLTKHFILLHNHPPGRGDKLQAGHRDKLIALRDKLFTLPPCHSDQLIFPDLNARYTYESLRLAGLLYAHALSTCTSFSSAALDLTSGTATATTGAWPPGLSATESLHIQIRAALLKTDCSAVWGPLAGVLFWITLLAGAAANPGPLAQEERIGVEEDGRKFLAAIAVRCSIVLSFEFGEAVLEMLRRLVWVEGVLSSQGATLSEGLQAADEDNCSPDTVPEKTWKHGPWTSEPGIATFVNGDEVSGPERPSMQHEQKQGTWTQMSDFAWDFEGLG